MFSKLFKKIEGLMQNLTLITIYLVFAYFMDASIKIYYIFLMRQFGNYKNKSR